MSERIVLCATAAQAAEFCHAERLLKEPKKSVFERLGPVPEHRPRRQHDRDVNERAGGSYHSHPRRGGAPSSTFVFMRGSALIGDSILVRMAKAGGSFVSRNSNTCYGGATAADLYRNLKEMRIPFPRKVVLLAGTNDLMKDTPRWNIFENLRGITKMMLSKGCHVTILTIPPFEIEKPQHQNLEFINSNIKRLQSSRCTVLDMNEAFKKDDGPIWDLYERRYLNGKRDLVHPNTKGLRLMISKIFKGKDDHKTHQYRHQRNSSTRDPYEEKDLMEFSE